MKTEKIKIDIRKLGKVVEKNGQKFLKIKLNETQMVKDEKGEVVGVNLHLFE